MSLSQNEAERLHELLLRARGGCTESERQLIEHCRSYLLLIANSDLDLRLQRKVGASDVVQETLFKAQHNLASFRGDSWPEFTGWLRTILKNDIRQARRRFRDAAMRSLDRESPSGSVAVSAVATGDPTPSVQMMADEKTESLRSALQSLPASYQEVIRMRNWEQLAFDEIGARLHLSADAARKTWSRAIFALQKKLLAHGEKNVG